MPTPITIASEQIVHLYTRELLSSYQIAKRLGCSQSTVMSRLRTYKIDTRTIQEGKALTKPKYPRKNFDGTKSDMAYLIGFRLGDLNVSKTHPNSPTIRVMTNSTRQEQIDLVLKLFGPYGHVKVTGPDSRGAKNVRCYLNTSFSFLVPKSASPPKWILETKRCSLAFLAGYIDAEGSFGLNIRNQPFFGIKSQDREIMSLIQAHILPLISVRTKLHLVRLKGSVMGGVRSNKDVYGIFVYNRRDLRRILSELLPILKHKKRRADGLKVYNFLKHVGS